MSINTLEIFHQFITGTKPLSCEPYGGGHINDSYLVKTDSEKNYILQRINQHVFHDIPALMNNILQVSEHLRAKLKKIPGSNPDREALTILSSHQGSPFYIDRENHYWRLCLFISPHRCYDFPDTPQKTFEGGRMFGRFQRLLADFPIERLVETIPNFHHIGKHLKSFEKIVARNPYQRAHDLEPEFAFIRQHADAMHSVLRLGEAGKIPLRVTHNDPKFNNVLLDENDRGLCVIDLDTVMPGYIHYDFADSVRAMTSTAAEDEPDLTKIAMDIELFEAFVTGFLGEVKTILNPVECDTLAGSAKLFPYALGVRFLTDYLNNDQYFKTQFSTHNLQRARAQFQLAKSMMKQEGEMIETVKRVLNAS